VKVPAIELDVKRIEAHFVFWFLNHIKQYFLLHNMSWILFVYLLSTVLTTALLGRSMYGVRLHATVLLALFCMWYSNECMKP